MHWFDWLLIGYFAGNVFVSIGMIGKERKPLRPIVVVFATIIYALLIIGVIAYRG